MKALVTSIETHCIDLDRSASSADLALTTAAERGRAAQFRLAVDARRFLGRRAATRRLLAARLHADPREIVICEGAFGKPYLADVPLQFSTSHAGPLLLVAMSDRLPLGCDIERTSADHDLLAIATTCFTDRESSRIVALSGADRIAAFYDCWTRKEAYLKAIGTGMSLPMNSFEFVCAPVGGARLDNGGTDWSSTGWDPAPGYRAAIVAPGHHWQLNRR